MGIDEKFAIDVLALLLVDAIDAQHDELKRANDVANYESRAYHKGAADAHLERAESIRAAMEKVGSGATVEVAS